MEVNSYYQEKSLELLRKAKMLFEHEYWDLDYIKETKEFITEVEDFLSYLRQHGQPELKALIKDIWD